MVRLVDQDEVPVGGCLQLRLALGTLGQLTGGQHQRAVRPSVTLRGLHASVQVGEAVPVVKGDDQGELFPEFLHPLPMHRLGHQKQRPPHPSREHQLTQQEPGLDGLAQAHLVTQQKRLGIGLQHLVVHAGLVGIGPDAAVDRVVPLLREMAATPGRGIVGIERAR